MRRVSPPIIVEPARAESTGHRRLFVALALLVTFLFFALSHAFWAPAHGGVDQNGYLVGGKMFAQHGSTKLQIINPITGRRDPYLFVGLMWIGTDLGTDHERFYPKYPIGLPALVAGAIGLGRLANAVHLGGPELGVTLTYLINPICMSLAVLGTFWLTRLVAGSFAAVMGMIVFALSPVTLLLTNDPNSHASAVFCVAVGMYLLLRWWQAGGWTRAFFAGFLISYAATIRYTEATLAGAIGLVIIFRLWPEARPMLHWSGRRLAHEGSLLADALQERRLLPLDLAGAMRKWLGVNGELEAPPRDWLEWRPWLQSGLLMLGWAIPVAWLVLHNLIGFGSLTGYDPTNESAGFRWEYFESNWETMLRQLNAMGLFFLFPLGLAGLVWMFWWHWRLACVLATWIVPNMVIYAFYYWAPDGSHTGYLRFFLTIFPALTMCGFWLLAELTRALANQARTAPAFGRLMPLGMGIVTALAVLVMMETNRPALDGQQRHMLLLHRATQEIQGWGEGKARIPAAVPAGSVLFAPSHFLHHLQFAGDYICYDGDLFSYWRIRGFKTVEPDEPQYFQPQRAQEIYERLKNFSDAELIGEQKRVMQQALQAGRRVFCVVPRNGLAGLRLRLAPTMLEERELFDVVPVAAWNDPSLTPRLKPTRPIPRRLRPERPADDPRNSTWYVAEVKMRTEPVERALPRIQEATELLKAR